MSPRNMAAMSRRKAAGKKHAVRAEVANLVHGPSYMTFDDVVADFPMAQINTLPPNVPYTPWHLLEHMRIAQRDILEYIEDRRYRQPRWPEDYWPDRAARADARAWRKTVTGFRRDRAALEKIAGNPRIALDAPLPYAPRHTYIRELLIVSEHNTYHIGELAILRQVLGAWPAER